MFLKQITEVEIMSILSYFSKERTANRLIIMAKDLIASELPPTLVLN